MRLYAKISITQARSDLKYLKDTYGITYDFCGAFCNTRAFENILMGKISVKEVIVDNIKYYFSGGLNRERSRFSLHEYPNINDKRVKRIIDRYDIEL